MIIAETKLKDTYLIDIRKIQDQRGFFARAWCQKEFERHGMNPLLAQANIGVSIKKGTLRGMHFQIGPSAEVKLVRCTRGTIFDVGIDLRPESSTFKQWLGVELSEENHRMLYLPEGFAHGYQSLTDNAEVFYHTSKVYSAEAARGVRYDDPAFGIKWPLEVQVISEADMNWPDYLPTQTGRRTES
jgi:dTDP-4-dehydrorhamnose 3,5-epimerase